MPRPRVVILGGGFGGLNAARALRRAPVDVTLVDRRNYHLFQPLLYQVATASLGAPEVSSPIRRVLRGQANTRVLLAEVRGVDLERRVVHLDQGQDLGYDHLVVALGAVDSYFGHDAWAEHAPGLKTIDQALRIRSQVLTAFEAAEREPDPEKRKALLTFVVIGAGATGVELSGALAEIAQRTLADEFRSFDPAEARVVLVEAADRVLPPFEERLSDKGRRRLAHMGVEVRTGTRVTDVDARGVTTEGDRIDARTVIWAAGVAASPLAKDLGVALDAKGRVQVGPDLSIPGHPEAFVVGDLAGFEQDGAPLPGVAQVAIQGGRHVARVLRAEVAGRPRPRFRYHDRGQLVVVGRSYALADLPFGRFAGFFAWVLWLVIHLLFLIGFRNKVVVMMDWAWAYLTHRQSARLITASAPPADDTGGTPWKHVAPPPRPEPKRERPASST